MYIRYTMLPWQPFDMAGVYFTHMPKTSIFKS